jgi:PAS domain S-box-containing protein
MVAIIKNNNSIQEQSKLKEPSVTATSAVFIRRLVFGMLLINLLIIFVVCLSLYQSRLQYEKEAAVSTQNLVRVIESDITNLIDKSNVALLAVKYEVERQLAGGGIKNQVINAYMAQQGEHIPELLSVLMTNSKGEIMYGTNVRHPLISVADRDYFIQARDNPKGGIFISKPVLSRVSGKWVVLISRRVSKPDGSFYGVVWGTLTVEYFKQLFAKLNLGENGVISLRSSDMSLIARRPESKSIGVSIGEKRVSKELLELIKSGQTSGTYFTPISNDNIPRTTSYSKVGNYPLYTIVGLAQSEYMAQWWKEVKTMSLAGFISTAIIMLSSWLIYYDWMRGIKSLKVLEEQEKKYRIVADNTYDWEFWVNSEGSFIYTSPSCKRVVGYSRKDFETTPDLLSRIVHPDDRSLLTEHRHTATDRRIPEEIEFRVIRADGAVRWIAHICQPVFDSNGVFLGTRGSNRDITERKRMETERERLILELQEALANVKRLSGLLPICASCKKIRNDEGFWEQVETYITEHSQALFSHAICPDCGKKLYPQYYDDVWGKEDK